MRQHIEYIRCPECKSIERAEVKHTLQWWALIYDCSNCGNVIIWYGWDKDGICQNCGAQIDGKNLCGGELDHLPDA